MPIVQALPLLGSWSAIIVESRHPDDSGSCLGVRQSLQASNCGQGGAATAGLVCFWNPWDAVAGACQNIDAILLLHCQYQGLGLVAAFVLFDSISQAYQEQSPQRSSLSRPSLVCAANPFPSLPAFGSSS